MRNSAAFRWRDFGGGDFDLPVDLDRIAVDDLSAETKRHFYAELAFAGCSRTDDCDNRSAVRLIAVAGNARVLAVVLFYFRRVHPRVMISRIAITSQMTVSSRIAPMIWAREKRIEVTVA